MKRRVAGLPPVSASVFDQKVLERREQTAVMLSPKGSICETCGKAYTTENAYRSHVNSKKHKENELKALSKPKPVLQPSAQDGDDADAANSVAAPEAIVTQETVLPSTAEKEESFVVEEDATEEDIISALDRKIAAARSRLSPAHCLFCTLVSPSLEENLTHMSTVHSFFIPDAEYLVDLPGLIAYLGEKIAVGNICLYCNSKSREFRTLEATRKHMVDKSHCKIAYESEPDMLEVSDYYDFSASYPDAEEHAKRKAARRAEREKKRQAEGEQAADNADWVDDDDSEREADEVVDVDASDPEASDSPSSDESESEGDDDSLPDNQITYGDTHYELVLPNGSRLIHRDMQRYFKQRISLSTAARGGRTEDPKSGAALVRRLLAEKNSALVPRKGGFGAFGAGMEVVKARNPGEAREAGRHVREFRDQNRREQFKTKVGFRHNYQKHYRDPLLQ